MPSLAIGNHSSFRENEDQRRLELSSSSSLSRMTPPTDREVVEQHGHNQELAAQNVLNGIGAFLEHADQSIDRLDQDERNDHLLSLAIVRGCQDLACAVRTVADELEQQSHDEKRALAQACLADIQNSQQQLRLIAAGPNFDNHYDMLDDNDNDLGTQMAEQLVSHEMQRLSQMDENDMVRVIDAAQNFLRDVESSLLTIDENAAEELAEVALTVARLFVASLQSIHAQIAPEDLMASQQHRQHRPMDIEVLEDDDNDEEQQGNTDGPRKRKSRSNQKRPSSRMRVLWPPIGPKVSSCLQWAQQEASKRPILTVALGIVLWPAAVTTALLGTPLVWFDGFVQDMYNHFDDAPLIVGLERGAAQLYHTGRLAWISGKLVTKQTLQIAQKQVDRHGGLHRIAQNCAGMVVHRATHPIETIQGAYSGVLWGVDQVQQLLQELQDQERQQAAEELQT